MQILNGLNNSIVFSLSPGVSATPEMAQMVSSLVNMYRVTKDDWDAWPAILSHFNVSRYLIKCVIQRLTSKYVNFSSTFLLLLYRHNHLHFSLIWFTFQRLCRIKFNRSTRSQGKILAWFGHATIWMANWCRLA